MSTRVSRRSVLRIGAAIGAAVAGVTLAGRVARALDIDFGTVKQWGTASGHGLPVVMPADAFPIVSDYGALHGPTGRLRAEYGGTGLNPVHGGIDILAPAGTPVIAAASGDVIFSGAADCPGEMIALEHGYDFKTWYSHLDIRFAAKGARVERGEVIGLVGLTGSCIAPAAPHLHFEVRYYDALATVNPHRFWHGGPGIVTLFRPGARYPGRLLTYPIPGKRDLGLFQL